MDIDFPQLHVLNGCRLSATAFIQWILTFRAPWQMRNVVKKTFVKMKNEWKISGLPAPRSACLWCRLRPALPACGVDGSRWISIELDLDGALDLDELGARISMELWISMEGSRWAALWISMELDGWSSMDGPRWMDLDGWTSMDGSRWSSGSRWQALWISMELDGWSSRWISNGSRWISMDHWIIGSSRPRS